MARNQNKFKPFIRTFNPAYKNRMLPTWDEASGANKVKYNLYELYKPQTSRAPMYEALGWREREREEIEGKRCWQRPRWTSRVLVSHEEDAVDELGS